MRTHSAFLFALVAGSLVGPFLTPTDARAQDEAPQEEAPARDHAPDREAPGDGETHPGEANPGEAHAGEAHADEASPGEANPGEAHAGEAHAGDTHPGAPEAPAGAPPAATSAIAPDPRAVLARRELIEAAQAAATAGDHERALLLGQRAARLRVSPSLQLFIAQQQALAEHYLEALANARACAIAARRNRGLANREVVLETCEALAREVEGRVATLTLRVGTATRADQVIEVGGEAIDRALWDVPFPVLPGTYAIDARAEAWTFHADVTLEAGERHEIEVVLVPPEGAAPELAESAPRPVISEPERAPASSSGISPAFFAMGAGLTLVGAGVATATGVLALNEADRFDRLADRCWGGDMDACADAGAARDSSGELQTTTNALWIATAILGAATIVTIVLTDFGGGPEPAEVELRTRPGGGELRFQARF